MSNTNNIEASGGGGSHTHVQQINSAAPGVNHNNSDTFLTYLEKNKRSLKKRSTGNASEKKSVDAELELIEKMRKHYLLSQTNNSSHLNSKISPSSHGQENQGVSFSEALHRQQQELLERVADLIYFSKLAHMGRIQSDSLSKFYEENLLAERKPYCEMTYGQERNNLRDQLEAGVLENESDLWKQLTGVEKSVLSDTIQPQILELDEQDEEEDEQGYAKQIDSSNIAGDHSAVEEEDEQFASKQLTKNDGQQDGENDGDCSLQFIHQQHQKNVIMDSSINNNIKNNSNTQQHNIKQSQHQQLPMLGHVYSQNYDGDSEKSHTENEIDMIHDRSKGKNIINNGGNANNSNLQVQQQQQLLKKAETDQAQYLSESQLQEDNQQQSQNAVKGFRRYKQNRYREERFAYQKKTKLQEIIKEEVPKQKDAYESDQCQSVDAGTQIFQIDAQKQQQQRKDDLSNNSNNCNNNNDNDEDEEEDESSAAHSANQIANNDSNSANNVSHNNNNNNTPISSITNTNVTHTKKHHGQNKTRHNPCRNDNQYETDREKEQEGSKKMLSTGQAKKTQVIQQQQHQESPQ